MLDHPAWHIDDGIPVRAMRSSTTSILITAPDSCTMIACGDGAHPIVDLYEPATLNETPIPAGLRAALNRLGPVQRVRNADLWDALATAIIRQVIRATQARTMYRALLNAVGQRAGEQCLPPTAEQVLAMPERAFTALGMAFKRRPLHAAANAYLQYRDEWAVLPADALVKALQTVPRIGPWTAGAAVADHTGDFSLYPYADLAVRTWATKADPNTDWPTGEPDFAALWRDLAGPNLSTLTALTLAWGDQHAHRPPSHPWSQP